jgi:hypothetical protein
MSKAYTSPYASAKQRRMRRRHNTKRATTAEAAVIKIRRRSILISLLARLISYRTSDEMSFAASATSSPSDCCPSVPPGLPLRTIASLPDPHRQRVLPQVVQG